MEKKEALELVDRIEKLVILLNGKVYKNRLGEEERIKIFDFVFQMIKRDIKYDNKGSIDCCLVYGYKDEIDHLDVVVIDNGFFSRDFWIEENHYDVRDTNYFNFLKYFFENYSENVKEEMVDLFSECLGQNKSNVNLHIISKLMIE